ncbi:unnamed protein product [Effrenium voratum]|uniref:Alpha/beta hydrolase fold-3 domain-containing protein n=1 Tax=Effrenium voratum TaxID=2562239 RepID=A0AA36NGL2_9DINO|nr:unnamed protein product [Effrenium voratum]CAJ1413344.1 unnamed protein product [Effrenium voratum]
MKRSGLEADETAEDVCRRRLLQDSSCCLNQEHSSSVVQSRRSRPGTAWECSNAKGCLDETEGLRGEDLISIPLEANCDCRILFVHGGAWYYGAPWTDGYSSLASRLASMTRCIVMVPDYPLLPAGSVHSILDAAVAALRHLASEALCQGTGPVRIFLGGDSAGGATALSLLFRLQQAADPLIPRAEIAGAFFWSPWTNLACDTPEYVSNAYSRLGAGSAAHTGDILFRDEPATSRALFGNNSLAYVGGDTRLLRDALYSPFFAHKELLAGAPPLYFAVGSAEAILGDSTILAQKAAAFGVPVVLDIFQGMWHDFPMYSEGCGASLPLWQGQRAWNNTAEFIRSVAEASNVGGSAGWPLTRYIYDESLAHRRGWFAQAHSFAWKPGSSCTSGSWLGSLSWLLLILASLAVAICFAETFLEAKYRLLATLDRRFRKRRAFAEELAPLMSKH